MLFNSAIFAVFFAIVLFLYAAGRIHGSVRLGRRRAWLLLSLFTNLGILAVFKYGNFVVENLDLFWYFGISSPKLPDTIPIGISFYTFQTLSYTIDVYRRRAAPARNALDFALYVSFFAQLVAGPIVRATEFLPQVRSLSQLRGDRVSHGLQLFVRGLFKKIVIADNVGLFVDVVFAAPGHYSAITLWCGAYAFALQIYCDFSGYTDMALGIGRVFGLKLPANFDAPYLATSIRDFWRRWHISLSTWLRDYLYISLGGSRRSAGRTYANLMLTMLLGGLWHGAAWTFVLWGAFHGFWLALERWADERRRAPLAPNSPFAILVKRVVTFHLVCVGWVIFRSQSFADLSIYLARMFTEWSWSGRGESIGLLWAGVLLALVLSGSLARNLRLGETLWPRLIPAAQGAALAALAVVVGLLHGDSNAFIYFQF
jgi:alginate O-acetyltransferase complex protein AlgI